MKPVSGYGLMAFLNLMTIDYLGDHRLRNTILTPGMSLEKRRLIALLVQRCGKLSHMRSAAGATQTSYARLPSSDIVERALVYTVDCILNVIYIIFIILRN